MKSYVILGDSGFIGSGFLRRLTFNNERVIGINRSRVTVIENGNLIEYSRKSSDIFNEMERHLTGDTTVINAIWGKNDRQNRQSPIHQEYALQEKSLIRQLEGSRAKYLSFGSIAEIDDEQISPSWGTEYSKAKKQICEYLASSSLQSLWLRIASCYGPEDNRDWLLTQLSKGWKRREELVVENPNQCLNLCHIDSLVKAALELLGGIQTGIFNVTTDQWLTVAEIKNCFNTLVEPKYLARASGVFSHNDSEALIVSTPLISQYFEYLKGDYRS